MPTKRQEKTFDERLLKIAAHPVRGRALIILAERVASPKEIAQEIGEYDVGKVSYHVKELENLGVVELVEERPVRGAIEHFYRATMRPMFSDLEWEEMPVEERQRFSALILQLMMFDASRSLREGVFDRRTDRHLSRTPLVVDEEGWDELQAIMERDLNDVLEVQARSAERAATDGIETAIAVWANLMFFEAAQFRHGTP